MNLSTTLKLAARNTTRRKARTALTIGMVVVSVALLGVTAFAQAPQFTIGNSSRNPVVGPGYRAADVMIGKTFQLTERLRAEFRAEAFNVTNHPNFSQPSGLLGTVSGAVIVTTPQEVALLDSRKSVTFCKDSEVPIIGIVENMSYFTPAELPQNKYYLFGKGGGQKLADEFNVEVLGKLPLVQSIREAADAGRPAVLQQTTPQAKSFTELAQKIAQKIAVSHATQQATELV